MKPSVQPLAYWQRKLIFFLLLLSFLLALPAFMFYATGYRYDLFSESPSITATGALYIAADAVDSAIYVDGEEITNARVFRKASYIQGLVPDQHEVHIQSPKRHTWVKKLSVYPHIVTEAEAFNLPLVPQVRPITQYETLRGEMVFSSASSSVDFLLKASTTVPIILSTTTSTSTFKINQEYKLLSELFMKQASTTALLKEREKKVVADFGFATTTPTATTTMEVATTTVIRNSLTLYKKGDDVVVGTLGTGRQVPHYFCTTPIEQIGSLETENVETLEKGELMFEETLTELSKNTRDCRFQIIIDRQGEEVRGFDFLPSNENLVLVLRTSGLYVTEIDDRVWQNTQPLYTGNNLDFVVYNNNIFVKNGPFIWEVFVDLPTK